MHKYKFLLWDVDGTLIDFDESERISLSNCFSSFRVSLSSDNIKKYSEINKGYWQMLEKGEITKPELLLARFRDFCDYLKVSHIDPAEINAMFQIELGKNCVLNDDAYKLCSDLKSQFKQYVVTNGTAVAQYGKLKITGLIDVMDDIFISEEIGFEKPNINFFNSVFCKIPNFQKEHALIIGDSLTSDMQGGNYSGIDCCLYDPKEMHLEHSLNIKYKIKNLQELRSILDR